MKETATGSVVGQDKMVDRFEAEPGARRAAVSKAEHAQLKAEREAGRKALKQLLRPVAVYLNVGRVLAVIAGVLAIAPYVALVVLGNIIYQAYAAGETVDRDAVWGTVMWLVGLFGMRLFVNAVALLVTHYADIKMSALVKERMIGRLGHAPLGWFSKTNAGKVRKAIQDDLCMVHALVAHKPVDVTQAVVTPIALIGLAFYIDWRLALLTVASLPAYIAANVWMMQDLGEKTVEMDAHLGRVSAMMVEFFMGIFVVKAFGVVGQAHKRYQDAADDLSHFYLAWVTPMLRGSAAATAAISIPILLAINLGGGAAMARAGWVTPPEVLTTTLIALTVPAAITVVSSMTWAYQMAGAAAHRIVKTLEIPVMETPSVEPEMHGHAVEFSNVSFSYGDHVAVEGVDLRLEEDTVTALIGASGSGKST
ncbi:ABC transporter transmembrane domain-containing protein [Corynebacterium phocae]|uniref:ABC transporter transmembrane domain-containing protein n=1 Tax=Corynebacterium phocae TaxID=161895 RepID=UPI001FE6518D|nr:ABC transporter ATP-binding protein [Corynebacterium phocae]